MISAPARASKKVMLRGSLPGSLLAMLWGVASDPTYARQRYRRLRRESSIAAPRKVESVAPAGPKDLTSASVSLGSENNSDSTRSL